MRVRILTFLLLVAVSTLAHGQLAPVFPTTSRDVTVNALLDPSSAVPEPSSSAGLHAALPTQLSPVLAIATPPVSTKVIDSKFAALGALVFALTAADVELTQHCLHAKTCYEMNPTLPNSRWGQYAVNTATNLGVMYFSYRRKKSEKWGWWVAPVVDIGAHTFGVGTNLRFVH
jgi:hypothetical protein